MKIDPANTAWMLTASVLVLFMTLPGLALFYGGLVRAKNFLSVLMHCFAIGALVSLRRTVLVESIGLIFVILCRGCIQPSVVPVLASNVALTKRVGICQPFALRSLSPHVVRGDLVHAVYFRLGKLTHCSPPAALAGALRNRAAINSAIDLPP